MSLTIDHKGCGYGLRVEAMAGPDLRVVQTGAENNHTFKKQAVVRGGQRGGEPAQPLVRGHELGTRPCDDLIVRGQSGHGCAGRFRRRVTALGSSAIGCVEVVIMDNSCARTRAGKTADVCPRHDNSVVVESILVSRQLTAQAKALAHIRIHIVEMVVVVS